MFAYCLNNPVNMIDCAGESPANIIGGIVGGVAGAGLGLLLSDQLGLTGWKKIALVAGTTIGGAVLGALVGPQVAKIGSRVATRISVNTATKAVYRSIGRITPKTMNHMNIPRHLWSKVLKKVTDEGIERLVNQAIKKGTWEILADDVCIISYKYKGEIITVTGRIIDGVFRISNAWVNH